MAIAGRTNAPQLERRCAGRRRIVAACSAAVLVLAVGCGPDADEADGETLEDFFGFGTDQEELMAQAAAQQREVEESIAACMASEGFEYVPQDVGEMMMAADHPSQNLSEEEFRREYGYGISTLEREAFLGPGGGMDDPNLAIQEQMDEPERQAYEQALYGDQMAFDAGADPDDVEVAEIGGCQGEAVEEVQGDQMQVAEELMPELMALEEQINADPRMVEAMQGWRTCLSEAGYDFQERFDPQSHLFQRFEEFEQAAFEQMDPEGFEPDDGPIEPELDPDELEELRQDELEIAAVEGECTSAHLEDVEAEVRVEHEGAFIEENRDELEQMRLGD
jgi:hypothetical protein